MADLTLTSYAILGMLSLAPMSGYELVSAVGKTIAHFWTVSKSQAYAELPRLEVAGYVSGSAVAQDHAPDKVTYRLTAAGEAALDSWLAIPAYAPTKTRSQFLLKVFFSHRMPREVFDQILEQQRRDSERDREHLMSIVTQLDGVPEAFFTKIAALMGVYSAKATIEWIDDVRTMQPAPRAEPLSDKDFEAGGRELFATTPPRPKRRRRT